MSSYVTFTEKTKFIYAINKGITSKIRENPFNVNTFVAENERRIPFENMIYLGDGPSDIPCFSMIKNNGGYSIGINVDSKWHKEFQLELRKREIPGFKADYRTGSKLRNEIEKILSKT